MTDQKESLFCLSGCQAHIVPGELNCSHRPEGNQYGRSARSRTKAETGKQANQGATDMLGGCAGRVRIVGRQCWRRRKLSGAVQ